MADMIGLTILLTLLATAFPAYLTMIGRVWPEATQRARIRISLTPGRCLALGAALLALAALPIAVLLALPNGVAQFLGYTGIVLVLAFAGLGAAGFVARISASETLRGFLVGAALTEFAMAFPVIGWFLVTPLLLLASLGAGAFAALRWMPRERVASTAAPASTPVLATETQ